MLCITLKGQCVIVLNVHSPTEDKDDNIKDSFYKELEQVFDQFPRYHMKVLLGDFNVMLQREDIFKPIICNKGLHEVSNDNGIRVVNFATSDRSCLNRQKITFKYMSNPLEVADCDTDHYLVVAKLRKRISVSK
jgi:exonuclease III